MRQAILAEALRADLRYFVTLTLSRGRIPFDVCDVCLIHRIWDRFLKRLRRNLKGASLSYITVVEQQGGYAHLHVLMSNCADRKFIKKAWLQCGGGLLVHVSVAKVTDIRRIAFYVTKRLELSAIAGKLVTCSRDIKLRKPRRHESDWIIQRELKEGPWFSQYFDSDKCVHGYAISTLELYLERAFKLADDGGLHLFGNTTEKDINVLNKQVRLVPSTPEGSQEAQKRGQKAKKSGSHRKNGLEKGRKAVENVHKPLKRTKSRKETKKNVR